MRGVTNHIPTQHQADKRQESLESIRIDFYTKQIDRDEAMRRFRQYGHSQQGAVAAVNFIEALPRSRQIAWLKERHLNAKGETAYV